jgi:hypothetical protein
MGAQTSEVGYTSATTRRGDHEVYMDMRWHWGGKILDLDVGSTESRRCQDRTAKAKKPFPRREYNFQYTGGWFRTPGRNHYSPWPQIRLHYTSGTVDESIPLTFFEDPGDMQRINSVTESETKRKIKHLTEVALLTVLTQTICISCSTSKKDAE